MKQIVLVLIVLLAVIGLADSIYLTHNHYNSTAAGSGAGPFCTLENGKNACTVVETSAQGYVFGIPTSVLGILYFAIVLSAVVVRLALGRWIAPMFFTLFLVGGFFFSAYLIYTMYFVLQAVCVYCMVAHIANIIGIGLVGVSQRI